MTRPELGRSRPASTMRSVDLPEPEGPTRPAVSPFAIRRSMPLRILTGPAVLGRLSFTLSSSIIASVKKSPSLCSCLGRLLRRADGTLGLGSGNENGAGKKLPATLETKPATLETKVSYLMRYGHAASLCKFFFCAAFLFAVALTSPSFAAGENGGAEEKTSREITIVALGDSLTAGYLLGPSEGFADRLQAALHEAGHDNVKVLNAGVSGDTSAGGLARLDWAVGPEADAVIVELGANDA